MISRCAGTADFGWLCATCPTTFADRRCRLSRRIAGTDGTLDAAVIGRAAASLHQQAEAWRDWGSREDALQHLKQLWHVLVHYGSPSCASGSPASSQRFER